MPPSKILLGAEGFRAVYNYWLGSMFKIPVHQISPPGDGHPVMVLPGLGTTDNSTRHIRSFVDSLGYTSHGWGLGRNIGPRNGASNLLDQLVTRVEEISADSEDQQVTLIGWSLGGVYGREIAKVLPDIVRQVIAIGTPFKGDLCQLYAIRLYEFLSKDKSHRDPVTIKNISTPPPVPFTSIYSKTDGVVHWELSIEHPGPMIENIEIKDACHLSIGYDPMTMFILADRLTYNKECWVPYVLPDLTNF